MAAVASLLAVFNGLKIFASFMYKSMYQGVILFLDMRDGISGQFRKPSGQADSGHAPVAQAALPLLLIAGGNGSGGGRLLQTRMAFSMETIKFQGKPYQPAPGL